MGIGGKATGRESDHSPPSNTEINNAWSCTFTSNAFMTQWTTNEHRNSLIARSLTKYDNFIFE